MTVDIGQPTHTRACKVLGCERVVGPYFDARQADRALDEHRYIRHRSVRAGAPCPGPEHRKDESWAFLDGE